MSADRPDAPVPAPDAPPGPPPGAVDLDARRAPDRQLAPHRSKIGRISDHVAALSTDLTEWVELRIELAKAEVQEKVDDVKAQARRQIEPIVFFAAAGFVGLYFLGFLLTTLAWLFAWGFGADPMLRPTFFGFLAVTGLLGLIAAVLGLIGKRKQDQAKAIEARLKASPEITESDAAVPAPPSTRQLQEREAERARRTTA